MLPSCVRHRLFSVLLVVPMIVWPAPSALLADEDFLDETAEERQQRIEEMWKVDWTQLNFDEQRQIKSIRLVCKKYDMFDSAGDKTLLTVESTDAEELKFLAGSLQSLSTEAPVRGTLSLSGAFPWAELHITDQNDKLTTIWVFPAGFCIEERTSLSSTSFHSWAVAQLVNDLYERGCQRPLSKRIFNRLSGQAEIEDQKERYNRYAVDRERELLRRREPAAEEKQRPGE